MRKIKDNLLIGLIIGICGPLAAAFVFYLSKFSHTGLESFLELSVKEKLLSPLLSLCAVINLGIFYLFLNKEKYYIARGIILATFLYGFIIVVLKFVL